MARLLVQLVEEGVVHLILATSTLSEGVNLPFEVVLVPTLRRGQNDWMSPRDFANLAGRAGRPGHGTEGRCLVLLPGTPRGWSEVQLAKKYEELIKKLELALEAPSAAALGKSALAELLAFVCAQFVHSRCVFTTNSGQIGLEQSWKVL
jgi:superfamily II helicase